MRNAAFTGRNLIALIAVLVPFLLDSPKAAAQSEAVLYQFQKNGVDGIYPIGGLVRDNAGNFYGAAPGGGAYGNGVVFELSPNGSGGWTETLLHTFNSAAKDGASPNGNLILDSAGNLYGTTYQGGNGLYGGGIVYELKRAANGSWGERILYNFGRSATDGSAPAAGLVFDTAGNLYGTTVYGGSGNFDDGTVFELARQAGGKWSEKILFSFDGTDGFYPYSGLTMDHSGDLYGTTYSGGANNYGTVYELKKMTGGHWAQRVLHSFAYNGTDGTDPQSGVIFDSAGNLYGTTGYGGSNFGGVVFALTAGKSGAWTESILYSSGGKFAPLIFDGAGNLYGTSMNAGFYGFGEVFELSPAGGGVWNATVLYTFDEGVKDGYNPESDLIFDGSGNLYATTVLGGDGGCVNYQNTITGCGTVFEITP